MAINPDKCIKVTGRFHSTQGTVGEPALTNVVAGADEVYDDTVPYRYNGHIDCKEVTPVGTENPQELEWYEKVYNTLEPTLFEWVKTTDTSVDSEKTYGISIGAKQSDVNKQLYDRLDDIYEVTINADDVSKVITSDANKIINKEDGYVPTAAAVGEALGANFEDSLTSTSVVKGLTANMGRELNETKANKNGWYEQLVSGASLSLIGDDVDHKATFLERETGDSTAIGGINYSVDKGTAAIETIYGHTEKFNQLVKNGNFADGTTNWLGITTVSDGVASVVRTATGTSIYQNMSQPITYTQGHKYLITFDARSDNSATLVCVLPTSTSSDGASIYTYYANFTRISWIWTSGVIGLKSLAIRGYNQLDPTQDVAFSIKNVNVFDLTDIFGAGNEPSTVAEFEAWLANNIGIQDYYDYTPGTLISLNPDSLVSTGFNQWDEEWELGALNTTTGADSPNAQRIRSKGYISVIPNFTYYIKTPNGYTSTLCLYDVNKNFINSLDKTNSTFVVPQNCYYIRFYIGGANISTYSNDVCINPSDPTKNGTYMPYMKPSTVDLSWIKDIPDPNDSSKKLFPYGLLKAGDAYDEVTATKAIKRIGSVDLGSLGWSYIAATTWSCFTVDGGVTGKRPGGNLICSKYTKGAIYNTNNDKVCDANVYNINFYIRDTSYGTDASAFKTAMSGVILYYELATPIEVTFEELNTHPMNYEVEDGGREKMLPENTSTPTTTSLVADIRYPLNALEAIRNLQNNFSTQGALYQTFNSLCSALNSAITTGTFAVAPDEAVVGKFNFTFTPTENTQSVESNETI